MLNSCHVFASQQVQCIGALDPILAIEHNYNKFLISHAKLQI